ncbi:MAG: hypothetical protein ACLFUS_01250 [Candidatus Sumerlaeia bacterium]
MNPDKKTTADEKKPKRPFFRPEYWTPLVLFLMLWLGTAWFHHLMAGWNVNTRLALTYSMVEKGTFAIDDYHDLPILETGDKAFYGGHYYCDKAPALSFSAVPIYYLIWQSRLHNFALGQVHSKQYAQWVFWTRYILRVFTVSLPAALLGVLLWALARRFGATDWLAFLLAFGLICGTVLYGYATLFYAYLPSAFFCTMAYWLLLKGHDGREPREDGSSPLCYGMALFWSGLCLGLAWFYEYTAGLAGIGLGLYALYHVRHRPLSILKFVAGGMISVVIFYSYTWHIFGEFKIPYEYEVDDFFREEMAKGFQGIHLPRLNVLFYLTFHPFKGLFFYSPFLLLAFAGAWQVLSHYKKHRYVPDVLLALYVIFAYLAFNSGYYMWWGGWASGPRLLCPAIPFFVIPIAIWLSRQSLVRLTVFLCLLLPALAFHFIITATDPQVPDGIQPEPGRERNQILMDARLSDNFPSPIFNALIPAFFRGNVALNLGRLTFQLPGLLSLLPLWIIWFAGLGLLIVRWRKPQHASPTDSCNN